MTKLLLRFYEWESGDIKIGGESIRNISIETLRDRIAYISQDTFLFSGSIKENLQLAAPEATPQQIVRACQMSRAHDFIVKLPMQYDTRLDENGSNLSGGQRQRLAVARALLKNPDILIMDEATSNLDTVTEKAIEATLQALQGHITTIVIAHRLSTVRNCGAVYVMDEGKIKEQGSHAELMEADGIYAQFWKGQVGEDII